MSASNRNGDGMDNLAPHPLELITTTPHYDQAQHGLYVELLQEAVTKDDVCNIALMGPYGTGKSSIIKGFYASQEPGSTIVINVSRVVGSPQTNTTTDSGTESESNETEIDFLQEEIVKQLLYSLPADRLPDSRFKRIQQQPSRRHKQLSAIVAVILSTLITAILSVMGAYSKIVVEFQLPLFAPRTTLGTSTLLAILTLVSILFFVLIILRRVIIPWRINYVELPYIKAGNDSERSESVFNKYFDEIEYFFSATSVRTVVFEDLDRWDSPETLDDLRNINHLINISRRYGNNSDKPRQPIRFIYAIRPSVLRPKQERDASGRQRGETENTIDYDHAYSAKFADFTLSVVPFANSENISSFMKGELSKRGYTIPVELLDIASHALYDTRAAISLINDFLVYANKLEVLPDSDASLVAKNNGPTSPALPTVCSNGSRVNREQYDLHLDATTLFAVILYKQLMPLDYEKSLCGYSTLDEILNYAKLYKNHLINAHEHDLEYLYTIRARGCGQRAAAIKDSESRHYINERVRSILRTYAAKEADESRFDIMDISWSEPLGRIVKEIDMPHNRYRQNVTNGKRAHSIARHDSLDRLLVAAVEECISATREAITEVQQSDPIELWKGAKRRHPSVRAENLQLNALTSTNSPLVRLLYAGYINSHYPMYLSTYRDDYLSASARYYFYSHLQKYVCVDSSEEHILSAESAKAIVDHKSTYFTSNPAAVHPSILDYCFENRCDSNATHALKQILDTIAMRTDDATSSVTHVLRRYLIHSDHSSELVQELAKIDNFLLQRILDAYSSTRDEIRLREQIDCYLFALDDSDDPFPFMRSNKPLQYADALIGCITQCEYFRSVSDSPLPFHYRVRADHVFSWLEKITQDAIQRLEFKDLHEIREDYRSIIIERGYFAINRPNLQLVARHYDNEHIFPSLDSFIFRGPVSVPNDLTSKEERDACLTMSVKRILDNISLYLDTFESDSSFISVRDSNLLYHCLAHLGEHYSPNDHHGVTSSPKDLDSVVTSLITRADKNCVLKFWPKILNDCHDAYKIAIRTRHLVR